VDSGNRIPVLKLGHLLLVSIQVDMHDRMALALQEDLAKRIVETSARGVLIDISGLELVDSFIGRMLADIAAVARVLDAETVVVGGRELAILLVKNPAGANEVLRTLALEGGELDLFGVLNDRIADGRDVSWIWDADFEVLSGAVRRVTCAGTRAPEMALRLKYAGWPEELITVEPDVATSLDAAVAVAPGRLFALPTYTALLELRKLLADRGLAKEFWQ